MSESKRDFLFFSDDRSGIPTSSMHIADQLAKIGRVFWLNTYTRTPKFSVADISKALRILAGRSGKPQDLKHNESDSPITYLTPKSIPWFIPTIRKINGSLGKRFLNWIFKEYQIQNAILISTFPCTVDAFQRVHSETTQIYYCVDEWSEYPGLHSARWSQMEQEMLACVDGAAFTSRDLMQRKCDRVKQSLYLPHGVDFEHFSGSQRELAPVAEFETLRRPIVGFFGTMDIWVDLECIAVLAKRFPQCSFVVIGRSLVPLTVLEGINNVHLVGPVPYAELPRYTKYWDVGLIPFVYNDLTKAVNPLKLMEYFAVGVPVISTKLPDILDVPGPLYFADDHQQFGDCLDEVLSQDRDTLRSNAQDVAKKNSWKSRAESLARFADSSYKNR